MFTTLASRGSIRAAGLLAIAVLAMTALGLAMAHAANGPGCPPSEPAPPCPKSALWFNWPLGLHGRSPRSNLACGTERSGPPSGPLFGYYPTCWQRWPDIPPCCPTSIEPSIQWSTGEAVPTASAPSVTVPNPTVLNATVLSSRPPASETQWSPLSPSESAALMEGVSMHRERGASLSLSIPASASPAVDPKPKEPAKLEAASPTVADVPPDSITRPVFVSPKPREEANDPPEAAAAESTDNTPSTDAPSTDKPPTPQADESAETEPPAGEDSAD